VAAEPVAESRVSARGASASAWADVGDSAVERLITAARREGWDRALDAHAATAPFFVARLRNLALGNWHVLLTLPHQARALDVGCGFGALAAGLALSYRRALGIEMLPERLRFAALREPRGAIGLVRGSGHDLPFAPAMADLVTMNGVLEWAAYYVPGDPRALQLRMLGEARRLLVPSGVLAVAIENRYALETLMATRDTHTGLHFVPALPRRLANLVSRWRKGEEFRTYLYGLREYHALLRDAGFTRTRVLDLAPSYNDYDFVIAPEDGATYRLLWRNGWMRSFAPGTGAVRGRLARHRAERLGGVAYAYLALGGTDATALDPGHPLWAAVAPLGAAPGGARFGAALSCPGAMAVVTHEGGAVSGLVVLARPVLDASPLAVLRSRALADHLDGRLEPLGETDFADYRVAAFRVRAGR